MNSAHQTVVDPSPPEPPKRLASWYAPGWSDGIGDRLLMFDNTSAPSLELLRFRPELVAAPGFERALRERVELLSRLRHPSFSEIRAVESLDGGSGLSLVSNHVPGRRLSEILPDVQGPAFAAALIRQLTPALVYLQQQGNHVAHGALSADRIVVTPEGRLVIVEHVLGSALERLRFTAGRLWTDFGIAVIPATKSMAAQLDARTDVVQLAVVALTLLLGRPLRPEEGAHNLPLVLERIAQTNTQLSPTLFPPLRTWLERALQLDGPLFGSALEAQAGLEDLPQERGQQPPQFNRTLAPAELKVQVIPNVETRTVEAPANVAGTATIDVIAAARSTPEAAPAPIPPAEAPAPVQPQEPPARSRRSELLARLMRDTAPQQAPLPERTKDLPSFPSQRAALLARLTPRQFSKVEPIPEPPPPQPGEAAIPQVSSEPISQQRALALLAPRVAAPEKKKAPARQRAASWVMGSLAVLAIAEGAVIAALLYVRPTSGSAAITIDSVQPGSNVVVDGRTVGVTPLKLTVDSRMQSLRVLAPEAVTGTAGVAPRERHRDIPQAVETRAARTAAVARPGGLRVSSPIDLQIMEKGRLLGSSSAGSIVLPPGAHQLDLVNTALNFSTRESVTVKAGQVASLGVSLPNGRLSINALPWAEVWIDGKLAGETPIGNLTIPIGEHEVLFRHPQLGERRQSATVKPDTVTRVSANLQQ